MNGDQSAEPEKPPPSDATEGSGSNGADNLVKKRKKDCLKPIITTESFEGDAQSAQEDVETGLAGEASSTFQFRHALPGFLHLYGPTNGEQRAPDRNMEQSGSPDKTQGGGGAGQLQEH
ncbi:hypothetical protein E4U42_005579 [Claviceps africana]|uniref:Uncharacterized protein n=1 Tax=Claviceps africana TaxID=83212 RepID=A0A8K0NJY5_9HYPO|nr:hypothetical protein E4U42_005579 [Claviceps africana]